MRGFLCALQRAGWHASHLVMRFAEAADEDLAQLVRECWHKLPKRRPTFKEVRAHCTRKPGWRPYGDARARCSQIVEKLESLRGAE